MQTKQITMSLNQIREFKPCKQGWETLLKAQGKTLPDDVQIPLLDILKSNGIKDAIWCMRVNWFEHKELYMKFVYGCVERVKEYASSYASDASDASNLEHKKQYKHLKKLLQEYSNES